MNFYLYIKLAYVYHLVVFSHRDPFSYLNRYRYIYIYICICVATVALEQKDCDMLLLLLLRFFMRVYMWLRERDWWWCSGKKEKPLFSSSSFSLSFDRIWLMRYLTTTSYLSSLSLVGGILFARWKYTQRIVIRRRERTRQDNCVHYWNKWSCYTTSEQNDRREREGGTSGEIIFYFYYYHHIKNNTRWKNKR
jgi:hypothetical protein